MKRNFLFYTVVFAGAAVLAFFLTRSGLNSDTSEHAAADHQELMAEHNDAPTAEKPDSSDEIGLLLKEAHEAVYEKGVIMQGVQKYKRVLELDSNNVEAIYNLGMLSIQSNQLEKAKIRFEKLILLQPENQEYQKTLAEILEKLGK